MKILVDSNERREFVKSRIDTDCVSMYWDGGGGTTNVRISGENILIDMPFSVFEKLMED